MLDIEKINARFQSLGEIVLRLRWFNIIVFLCLLGAALYGMRFLQSDTNQDHWFMEGDAMLLAKERFEALFGNDDFCAVLVQVDNVFNPEILRKIRELGDELKAKVAYSDDVLSICHVEFTKGTEEGLEITDLVPDPVPDDPGQVALIQEMALSKVALKNRIVSEDGRETWIMLRLKPTPDDWLEQGKENPELLIGRQVNEIAGQEKYRVLNPKTTGLPVIDVEKRDFIAKETPRLLGISFLATIVILSLALRNVRGVIFPMLAASSAIVLVFGAQGFLGIRNDPSMIFLPIFLTLAVATSYSIHVFNMFDRAFVKSGQRLQSLSKAIGDTGWPLLFSAITTIAALLSFLFVPLRPIRWIGLTSACLVAVIYLIVMILLPALLSFGKDKNPSKTVTALAPRSSPLDRGLDYFGSRALNHPVLSLSLFVVLAVICLIGITRFEVSFDIRRTFGLDIPYVARISAIGESGVGSLYSYGIGIEFNHPDAAKDPENLRKLEQLTGEIHTLPLTKKVSSILDVIKDMNQVINADDPAHYQIPETREMVAQLLLLYENAGGAEAERWLDYDYQRYRLMVEVDDYNSGEAARELHFIRERCAQLFPDAKVLLTGSLSQFTVMLEYVTWGQLKSYFLSLATIALIMGLVFGSLRISLIGMIPNLAPGLVVGGIMGFAGIPLDIMTITIAPMLLGLAVDDTIHFINHCQLEHSRTRDYRESVRRAFVTVGKALFITSVVMSVCFSAYLSSSAKVFVHMAVLVVAGIVGALAADFFVTPPLLKRLHAFDPGGRKGSD